ncbi:flagellar hook-basal body complex protein FliE [Methylocapsa sp. S129]|uniref:flagellar hook-basal body complex protein FliE n=1 Tax=Methylocapsa sp. S129 TaxID=1641869 RepID=UPI00131C168F|nr:flagellar hook-basal body complex protein FliE [Methylocapsa sp. S129]
MIDGISALTASKSSIASLGAPSAAGSTVNAAGGADFGQIMNEVSGDAIGNLKTAEAASIGSLQGTTPVHEVVESIMSAQRSLQSFLAVRDKAVSAYQEISRMAI